MKTLKRIGEVILLLIGIYCFAAVSACMGRGSELENLCKAITGLEINKEE